MGTSLSWGVTDSLARESRPHSSNFQTGYLDFADPRIAAEAANNPSVIYNPSLGQRLDPVVFIHRQRWHWQSGFVP